MHTSPSYPSFEASPVLMLFPCTGTLPQQHIIQGREGGESKKMEGAREGKEEKTMREEPEGPGAAL